MEVIFDFDGTLADRCGCRPPWLFRLARLHGYLGTAEDALAALEGCTDFDAADRLGLEDRPEEFTRRLIEKNRRSLRTAVWDPDLGRVLRVLAGRHVLHVLSNRDQRSLEEGVTRVGWSEYFHCCVGSVPGLPGKPRTDLYRRLRARAPASEELAVYVGDKPIDREFARRAGLAFVAACWHRDTLRDDPYACAAVERLPTLLQRWRVGEEG